MRCWLLGLWLGAASGLALGLPALASSRTRPVAMKGPTLYEEYLKARDTDGGPDGAQDATRDDAVMDVTETRDAAPEVWPTTPAGPEPTGPFGYVQAFQDLLANVELPNVELPRPQFQSISEPPSGVSDTDVDYERVPWWLQGSDYSEQQRKDRRTVFMHDDWVRHRSSQRFLRNMLSIGSSGINQALSKELAFVTITAVFVVAFNMLFFTYQDLEGISHPGPLNFLDGNIKALVLPALPFSITLPALSLLLVFRTNTAYFRWNEARTLWGGLINNCRNVVRQANTFFPDDPHHNMLKRRIAAETAAFCKCLRNFLRGPSDDETLRAELYELVGFGLMSAEQADATMAAANRPMFALSAMSATLRKAEIDPISASRVDATISTLVDLTGANERIFKSPIPLVYSRLTARFLSLFLATLPLALWGQLGESWNHWATVPAEFLIAFFLFAVEEVGMQIEEPFSILPLEAFCNGAIEATSNEMLGASKSKVFEPDPWSSP